MNHFQSFDADKKHSVAERLSNVSLSLEGGVSALLQQEILQLADRDSTPSSLQERRLPPPPLYHSPQTPPSDVPVRVDHFLP